MSETIADMLALGSEQLRLLGDRLTERGMTADDAGAVAVHLQTIAEHGYLVCAKALHAIETPASGHPTRSASHGIELQASLAHAYGLFDAILHFAFDAQHAADAMTEGNPS